LELANHYETIGKDYKSTYESYFKFIQKNLPRSGRILDIGCADGYLLLLLRKLGYEPVGMDVARSFVERAKELTGCPVFQGKIEDMHMFNAEEFDCVVSTEVIEHVESPYNALKEIYRVLKSGGITIISTPNSHHITRILYPDLFVGPDIKNKHINCFDVTQWKILFSLCGFKLLGYKGFPNNSIFPRWKGLSRILNKIFKNKERFKKYIIFYAVKVKI